MPNIKLALTEDDVDGGVLLKKIDGSALPTSFYSSILGKCMNDLKNGNDDDLPTGGTILHKIASKGHRCDFYQAGRVLDIKLAYTSPALINANFPRDAMTIPGTSPVIIPPFCIKYQGSCDADLTKALVSKIDQISPKEILVTLNSLKDSNAQNKIYDRDFAVNFNVPGIGNISLDPKIINKPKDPVAFGPAVVGVCVAAFVTLGVQRLLSRNNVISVPASIASAVAGLVAGAIAVFIAVSTLAR